MGILGQDAIGLRLDPPKGSWAALKDQHAPQRIRPSGDSRLLFLSPRQKPRNRLLARDLRVVNSGLVRVATDRKHRFEIAVLAELFGRMLFLDGAPRLSP